MRKKYLDQLPSWYKENCECDLVMSDDIDALVSFCREEKVDGVITGFVDILLRPYMEVCRRLGLPCYITEKMLSMSTNKVDFKNTCDKYGVPVPQTYLMGSEIEQVVNIEFEYDRWGKIVLKI